jgi:protoporphyrinogen oxidase
VDGADIVVLGAGPAGLAAAHRAATRGRDVLVLERADGPGGLSASFRVAGLRVDHGSHRLHPATDPAILHLLRTLLGDDLQLRPRHGRLRLGDRWLAFPLRTTDVLRRLPPRFAAGAAFDTLAGPLRAARARRRSGRRADHADTGAVHADESFADVVRATLGPTMARHFYDPYAAKIWGRPAAELSGEAARRRIGARSPLDLARRLVQPGAHPRRSFWYPATGFGTLYERLAGDAAARGARLRFGAEVSGLDLTDGPRRGVRVVLADGSAVEAGAVWSTLPLAALTRLVAPGAPGAVTAAAGRLGTRALVLVYLVLTRPRWTEFDAHYLPGSESVCSRISEPRNYRDGPDPPDRTVLCGEIPCAVGDAVWTAAPEALAELVVAPFPALGLPAVEPAAVEVRRVPSAYPVYHRGYEADLATVGEWADALPGLLSFGRHGLFAHDNSHHALAEGWAAADALDGEGRLDRRRWADARAAFAGHVVED